MTPQLPNELADHPLGAAIAQAAAHAAGMKIEAPQASKSARMFWRIMLIITSVLLILLLQIGFLFVVLGLLPSVGAWLTDTHHRKHMFKAILCCNLAAIAPYVSKGLLPGSGPAFLELAILNPNTWLIIYSAAAAGWVLVWICRLMALATLTVAYTARKQYLEGTQETLLEEWGPLVRRRAESAN